MGCRGRGGYTINRGASVGELFCRNIRVILLQLDCYSRFQR